MTTMLFPDPRMRSPTAMGVYGLTDAVGGGAGCNLDTDLAALSETLERANALGLYQSSLVIAAQALYNANSNISISFADCARVAVGLRSMTAQLRTFVAANSPDGGTTPYIYEMTWFDTLKDQIQTLPSWVLPVAIGGGALLVAVTVGGAVARRRKKR